ncbi:NPCBM/NEW2 domain-containing protein [Actinoplanes sp. CA-030573]|uniref:NPCBM/NEW2 domain-containing protein n=1 Tax=Actinoplanes sp. CA-030573 TaxID=3239898 RepID=UPI003D8E2708
MVVLVIFAVLLSVVVYGWRRKKVDAAIALALVAVVVAVFAKPIEDFFDVFLESRPGGAAPQVVNPPSAGVTDARTSAAAPATTQPSQHARATGAPVTTSDVASDPEPATTPPKRPSGPRSMFVADFESSDVRSSSNTYEADSVNLDGRTYSKSSLPTCYYDDTWTEFTLHRKWTRFSALVGIKDEAQSDYSATVTIYLDGNLWKEPLTVKVGNPKSVRIDVTGVLKLKLICSPGTGHEGFIRLALGDALVSAPT